MTAYATIAGRREREPLRDNAIRLAIVGSRKFKNPNAYALALPHLQLGALIVDPDQIISGGADGMDKFAEAFAQIGLIPFRAFEPKTQRWAGPGGFEERNEEIAQTCTHLLSVRCELSTTYGSGWTADRAEALGRPVIRITIPSRGLAARMQGSWS